MGQGVGPGVGPWVGPVVGCGVGSGVGHGVDLYILYFYILCILCFYFITYSYVYLREGVRSPGMGPREGHR